MMGERYLLDPEIINQSRINKEELKNIFEQRYMSRFVHYLDLIIGWGWIVDENTSPKHLLSPMI